jgi:hypothetical protein
VHIRYERPDTCASDANAMQVSGVPFGLPGEILGDNADQWQGLVFGMTCRIYPDPWRCNPRPLWAALDAMGMQRPRILGWWDAACPITVLTSTIDYGHGGGSGPAVVASVFVADNLAGQPPRLAVALANWAGHEVAVRLVANMSALLALQWPSASRAGNASTLRLRAHTIKGFQSHGSWAMGEALTLQKKGHGENQGYLLELTT